MSSADSANIYEQDIPKITNKKIGLVYAEWHSEIVEKLIEGAKALLEKAGIEQKELYTASAPGSFELPQVANWLDKKHQLDAVICLGCVIKGETDHDIFINQSVSAALMQLGLARSKPYIFGLLTVKTKQQALDRAGGEYGNKGAEAALAAIKLLSTHSSLFDDRKKIGFV